MALIKLPTRPDLPNYRYRIDIENQVYELEFRYNGRMDRWFMDIKDELGVAIRTGIILLTGVDLFPYLKEAGLPQGDFLLVHETESQINPGRTDLGDTIDLFYNEVG